MRIRVDQDLCQGHSRCYRLAPNLFDTDDYGMASVRNDGIVSADDVELAELAIANCPELAILVVEGDSEG